MNLLINNVIVDVELAITPEQHFLGLQYRDFLDKDSGMLFLFDKVKDVDFHMHNVKFGLDIVFIKSNKIIKIDSVSPEDENIKCKQVDSVLEVNFGWCKENNVMVGCNIEGVKMQSKMAKKKFGVLYEIENVKGLLSDLDDIQSETSVEEGMETNIALIKKDIYSAIEECKTRIKENGQKLVRIKMQQEFDGFKEFQI
jgi:uncharacterized membrane protein (UPF0127 family)